MADAGWFQELIEAWFRAMRRRGRSPNTLRTYRTLVNHLGRWLAERPEIAGPEQLTARHLHTWQDAYLEGHPHKATQALAATAVRSLLRWAAREEMGIQPGLWERVDQVERPEDEPLVLEPETLTKIGAHYRKIKRRDLNGLRDRALWAFLLTTGARINEALQLKLADVDRERWVVTQKGGRRKRLVASQLAREWLLGYLLARGSDDVEALWVWVRPDGSRRPLLDRDANRIWSRLARRLKLLHFTSRYLRGTAATELQERGATSSETARVLGHRGLATIIRYTGLRERRQRELVDRLDELVPEAPPEPPAPRRRRRRRAV